MYSKDTAKILSIEGRLFNVDVHYVKRFVLWSPVIPFHPGMFSPVPDYVKVTIDTVVAIHKQEPQGDVLAFLTGQVNKIGVSLLPPMCY